MLSEFHNLNLQLCSKQYNKNFVLHLIVAPQLCSGWQHNYSTKTRQAGRANEQSMYSLMSMEYPYLLFMRHIWWSIFRCCSFFQHQCLLVICGSLRQLFPALVANACCSIGKITKSGQLNLRLETYLLDIFSLLCQSWQLDLNLWL
jgi:hypothetical protein